MPFAEKSTSKDEAGTTASGKPKKKKVVKAKEKKAAEKTEKTAKTASKPVPTSDATASEVKSSAVKFEGGSPESPTTLSVNELLKHSSSDIDIESKESGLPASESVVSDTPSPLENEPVPQTVGQLLLDAENDFEKHLLTLRISYSQLETRIVGFAEARQALSRQLRDLDGLADVMQSLSQLIFWVVVAIISIIVFDEHIQPLVFTLSTLLLSLTFVFAGTVKDMFLAMILIFAIKPYAVGDRVNIGKEKYRVHSIQLLTTTFRDLQNKIAIMPNNKLATATIQNLSRSGNVVVKMKLSVAFDTPATKLASLRQIILKHVSVLPSEWKGTVSMHLADLAPNTNTVNVSLLLSHLANYTQVGQWKRSKTELLHVIREAMINLNIAWKNPEFSVSIVNKEEIAEIMEHAQKWWDHTTKDNNPMKKLLSDDNSKKLISDDNNNNNNSINVTSSDVTTKQKK